MKLLIAIIQPTKLKAVQEALAKVGVERMTVCDAQGYGRQRGQTAIYRGLEYKTNLLRKISIEIVVNDDFLDRTVDTIESVARTGPEGTSATERSLSCPSWKRFASADWLTGRKQFESERNRVELSVSVLFLTNDLLFSSRMTGTGRQFGIPVTVIGSRASLEELLNSQPVAMVLIDLEHRDAEPAALAAIIAPLSPRPKSIAYGPHVKEILLAAAQAAGLDLVMSRGQFDKQIGSLFQTLASST